MGQINDLIAQILSCARVPRISCPHTFSWWRLPAFSSCSVGLAMRSKARGLAEHDGPPGWLEESDPAGCDFVRDGRSMPPSLTDHTACLGLGADLLLNVHKTTSCAMSHKEGMTWYSSRPMPSLWGLAKRIPCPVTQRDVQDRSSLQHFNGWPVLWAHYWIVCTLKKHGPLSHIHCNYTPILTFPPSQHLSADSHSVPDDNLRYFHLVSNCIVRECTQFAST